MTAPDMSALAQPGGIVHHAELIQGTDEWRAARCGILTASEMHLIVTPTLKAAGNDKERAHLYELLAQRITGHVEPSYISDDMLRGHEDEMEARILYAARYAPVAECGFITNDSFGFTLGYSPDGLVGEDGLIECKSRRQKYQAQTIIDAALGVIPAEYVIQIQTALLVSGRRWCDLVSYCGGMPMVTMRVYPDADTQEAILAAATAFEERLAAKLAAYRDALSIRVLRLVPTERRVEQEMVI